MDLRRNVSPPGWTLELDDQELGDIQSAVTARKETILKQTSLSGPLDEGPAVREILETAAERYDRYERFLEAMRTYWERNGPR